MTISFRPPGAPYTRRGRHVGADLRAPNHARPAAWRLDGEERGPRGRGPHEGVSHCVRLSLGETSTSAMQ